MTNTPVPTVSVIVPVYNTEDRIEKCIRSIQNQTLQDIEIIAVNDGSTDKSLKILEGLASSDKRLKVLSFPNGGTGFALRMGLRNATGKYVGFSGADDWIEADMFQTMVDYIEWDNTDLVICDILKETEQKREPTLKIMKHEIITQNIFEKLIYFKFDFSICNKLYKRKSLLTNQITFQDDLRLTQDLLFNLYVFCFINSVTLVPKSFYHYVSKDGSLMKSSQNKRIQSFNRIIELFRSFCLKNNIKSKWKTFEEHFGPGYQNYFFNLVLNSEETRKLSFFNYYAHVLSHLRLMDPLLLHPPLGTLSPYQRIKKRILIKKRFRIFSLLATLRHKTIFRCNLLFL